VFIVSSCYHYFYCYYYHYYELKCDLYVSLLKNSIIRLKSFCKNSLLFYMINDVNFTLSFCTISSLVLKQHSLCLISSYRVISTQALSVLHPTGTYSVLSLMSHRYFLGNTFWAKSDWESQNRLALTVCMLCGVVLNRVCTPEALQSQTAFCCCGRTRLRDLVGWRPGWSV